MDTLNVGQLVMSLVIGQFVNNIREKIVQLTQRFVETVVVDDFEYQVIIESDPEAGGYVVECPAIKGCVSQGETKEEALEMIQDAIAACLEVLSKRELRNCPGRRVGKSYERRDGGYHDKRNASC